MQRKRKYSNEFKLEAVRLTEEPGTTVAQIARDLGIHANLLSSWRRQFREQGMAAFPGQGRPRDEEVAALKRELARVKKERDFLKDAAAFFASQSR